ncbi:UNVERIFIED_CONTAM: hypothetical protein Slati_1491700 [Sesamum latifolium]|uniref:Uncharacterized protein n=1 Tax=Sesamum latifolium TaxID=2727402 RepID=A0AAW2X626_9LAMI
MYSALVLRSTSSAGHTYHHRHPSDTANAQPLLNPIVEDRIGRLEEMMVDMMAMMRQMRANSSTTGPSQPTASTTSPAQLSQPPTDPSRRMTTRWTTLIWRGV